MFNWYPYVALDFTDTAVFRDLQHTSHSQVLVWIHSSAIITARRRSVTFESSNLSESDSDSDFSSTSSCTTSPASPVENSASSVEPLKFVTKRKRKLDNDKTKGSKRLRSQEKDDNNEESGHPEHTQDLGETLAWLGPRLDAGPCTSLGVQQVVITAIRATDLTLGLRRIPAGFHVVIKIDGAECQTTNKPVYVDQAVVEWNELILLKTLGRASHLLKFGSACMRHLNWVLCSVMENSSAHSRSLLENYWIAAKNHIMLTNITAIIFQPKQGEIVSPCTSLFMTLEQRLSDENNAAALCLLTTLPSLDMDALALKMDAGHRLLVRYCRTQNRSDLDQSINHFERALDLCPTDHPYRPAALFNLATTKFVSCQANGTYLDLDTPISLFQDALDLRPTGHPDRPVTQLHLAISLLSRFAKRGFTTDADAAEELISKILDVCHANNHIYNAALLAIETSAQHPAGRIDASDLGQGQPTASMLPLSPDQLADRAEQCSRIDDPHALDEVISLHYNALEYYNTVHHCRGQLVCNLGTLMITRFNRRSNGKDLDQAITLLSEAVAFFPVGHPNRCKPLNNLASGLFRRFEHRGNVKDLDETIPLYREALALSAADHRDQIISLNNLAVPLAIRFEHRGNDEDLNEAITLQREVLALHPVGHTDRSTPLNNLGNGLSTRFEHRGNAEDLDEAITHQREALALRPVGHIDRSRSLDNFANALAVRFEHRGNGKDLDEAIMFHREALALHPVGHTARSSSLNSLANRLFRRFEHRGNVKDLDEAITLHREALALRPVGHTDRSKSLNNLANQLSTYFEHRGNVEDLDEAIALHREALALRPVGHTHRSASLYSLANQLSTRFHHQGNDEDLDEAITLLKEALALCPVGHTDRSLLLTSFGNQLSTRFNHRGNREDLNYSRENLRCALTQMTQYDPRRLTIHLSLAIVNLSSQKSGLDGTPSNEDIDILDAAMIHLKTAANFVTGGLLVRLRASLRWVSLARERSHASLLEAYATSMQLLDAYMSVTASLSSRHDAMKEFPRTLAADAASCALHSGDVGHAVELLEQGRTIIWTQITRLRTPLDSLQTCGDHAVALTKRFRYLSSLLHKPPADHPVGTPRVTVEAEATQYRRLMDEWNETVEEIRKIEGFSRFLLPPLFSDLQDAARDGPIVVLIASMSMSFCDAIIIPHKQLPTSIQLPTNFDKLANLAIAFQGAITKEPGPRGNQPALTKALRELWDDINHPAGALFTLDSVEPELELVRSLLPHPPTVSFTKITSVDATKSRALSALRKNAWLHFACHGTQKLHEPFNSAFLMRDQPLSLLDIAQVDLSRHQFAFLSACETAVGAFSTPDEAIHLAAGLQFAGVGSVVGTMWKVNDSTVQRLVEAFYKNLCGDGTMNSKRAAWALHRAVHSLAHDKEMPLDQRIVFMHVGV
ncbi:CHAT domain-containing protein [Suillus variegatus]|nr:CHAT domain-containing protein [Suillus variegatus]